MYVVTVGRKHLLGTAEFSDDMLGSIDGSVEGLIVGWNDGFDEGRRLALSLGLCDDIVLGRVDGIEECNEDGALLSVDDGLDEGNEVVGDGTALGRADGIEECNEDEPFDGALLGMEHC